MEKPDHEELADRRAAQAAREAFEARQAADRALRSARWCALIAVASVAMALVATWRATNTRELHVDVLRVADRIVVGQERGGPGLLLRTDGESAFLGMCPSGVGPDAHGIFLMAAPGEGAVRVVGPSLTRFAQLSVDDTPDLRELPRVLLVHDDRRNAMAAVNMPRWEGR